MARRCSNLLTAEDFRQAARRRLPRLFFDYIDGAAGDEITARRNADAFAEIALAVKRRTFDAEYVAVLVNAIRWACEDIGVFDTSERTAGHANHPVRVYADHGGACLQYRLQCHTDHCSAARATAMHSLQGRNPHPTRGTDPSGFPRR